MATFRADGTPANPTNRSDFLFGSNNGENIFARNGADTIFAQDGNDQVYGEANDDTLHGALGDDYLNGGSGDDVLHGEDGNDLLDGSDNDDFLYGGGEDDVLIGGPGRDYVYGGGEVDIISYSDGDGNDVVDGGSEFDYLSVFGRDEFGSDSLLGERYSLTADGAEFLVQRTSEDPLTIVGAEVEQVEFYTFGGADSIDVGDLTGTSVESILIFGGDGTERITNTGFTSITAFLEGDGDRFDGGLGADFVYGGSGADSLDGGEGNDNINGEGESDLLNGGAGNDILFGGDGDDDLVGGSDDDILFGEGGLDQFVYSIPPFGGGNDTITDFSPGEQVFLGGGITQAGLDTNANGLIDDGDDAAAVIDNNLFIDFAGNNSLSVSNTIFLTFGDSVFIV